MDAEEFQTTQLLRMYEEQEEEDEFQDKQIYDVEKILDRKIENRKKFYLIKWLGYPENESTWEPLSNLKNVKNMVKEFDIEYEKDFFLPDIESSSVQKKRTRSSINNQKENKNNKNNLLGIEFDQAIKKNEVNFQKNQQNEQQNNNFDNIHETNQDYSKREYIDDSNKRIKHVFCKGKIDKKNNEVQEIEEHPIEEGNFIKDEAEEIIKIVPTDSKDKYMCLVKWKVRSDGILAKPTYIDNETVKLIKPMLLVLFFEKGLRFIK